MAILVKHITNSRETLITVAEIEEWLWVALFMEYQHVIR